jgi:hypothetical protein
MRLPLKFLPKVSQRIADAIGGAILLAFGVNFFTDYASPSDFQRYSGFGDWLHSNVSVLPFLICSIALLLGGLGWFTVAVLNLVSGSPFNYLIVDSVGITYRNFWRENRYPWKVLGPIQPLHVSAWQGRSSQRRDWIVADTINGGSGGVGAFWSNPTDTLRIPSAVYLSGGVLIGSLDLVTNDAATWLEDLRNLARDGQLDAVEIPPPPSAFSAPIEIAVTPTTTPTAGAIERD